MDLRHTYLFQIVTTIYKKLRLYIIDICIIVNSTHCKRQIKIYYCIKVIKNGFVAMWRVDIKLLLWNVNKWKSKSMLFVGLKRVFEPSNVLCFMFGCLQKPFNNQHFTPNWVSSRSNLGFLLKNHFSFEIFIQ